MNAIVAPFRPLLRKIANRPARIFKRNNIEFHGKCGLEIGGASEVFSKTGPLPVYTIARKLDNLNFSSKTFWSEAGNNSSYKPDERLQAGITSVVDTNDLGELKQGSYDFILASHVIEHLANPIKNVCAWRLLLKPGGVLLLVAPYKRYSYDRNRPTTTIGHLDQDFASNVQEDDQTHFDEVIRLHDLKRDNTITTRQQLVERTMANFENRILHHHVFDRNLLELLGARCGFSGVESQVILPRHVVALLRNDNGG